MDGSTIFQRTESGRETIKTKSHKLTQSERMLLIIINGVTPLDILRKEVWSLSPDRFDRALKTLLKKELISEVLLPLHGQEAEELESEEVDRFLQQDPLDPVTIISFDPEDEFGMGFSPATVPGPGRQIPSGGVETFSVGQPAPTEELLPAPAPNAVLASIGSNAVEEANSAAEQDSLALKSLAIQLARDKERQEESFPVQPKADTSQSFIPAEPSPNLSDEWPEESFESKEIRPNKGQWIYWTALIAGVALIAIWLTYRILP